MNEDGRMTSDEVGRFVADHPRLMYFPFVLEDGRFNAGDWTEWLRDGSIIPGPPSGRGPLLMGNAVAADWEARATMLLAVAHAHAEAAAYYDTLLQLRRATTDADEDAPTEQE
jgi:hypothetical protein